MVEASNLGGHKSALEVEIDEIFRSIFEEYFFDWSARHGDCRGVLCVRSGEWRQRKSRPYLVRNGGGDYYAGFDGMVGFFECRTHTPPAAGKYALLGRLYRWGASSRRRCVLCHRFRHIS